MYLESLTIKNFRKFKDKNNTVHFVGSKEIAVKKDQENKSLVAPSSTLIIGKNNTGKTTIARALNLIVNKQKPKAYDLNIDYLRELLTLYETTLAKNESIEELETPSIEFKLQVKVNIKKTIKPDDTKDEDDSDIVNNLYQFIPISSSTPDLIEIIVKAHMREDSAFRNEVSNIIKADYSKIDKNKIAVKKMEMLCGFLNSDQNLYTTSYFTSAGVEVADPALSELIQIKEIKANRHLSDKVLSDVYQKIISSQYAANEEDKKRLNQSIKNINDEIDGSVGEKSESISEILKEIENSHHVGVSLTGNVSENSILKNLIKYSFRDGDDFIPEDQFGLGYVNLLNIIGEIIHYIDGYEDNSHQNRVNLLFIEEPEAFMHPQMQEFFITRIDNAVQRMLELAAGKKKTNSKSLHCQIVITTHSSHIVNSKIHSCNSFDNINYLTSINKFSQVIKLDDATVCGKENPEIDDDLKFIKKHIKYKVSELFFADAIIFVEGVTEETLLHFYLDKNPTLRNYYISIFNINGAHGELYHPLIKALQIPCLVVTDLDIKREACEKNETNPDHTKEAECSYCGKAAGVEDHKEFKQITSLQKRITTNSTIAKFNRETLSEDTNNTKLEAINYFTSSNLHVVFQKDPIQGQYATSFEEAFILSNFDNDILNSVLESCKPIIYKLIVSPKGDKNTSNLINRSFEFQRKLKNSKSEFANNLLYKIIIDEEKLPKLPTYIQDGIDWLVKRLTPGRNVLEENNNDAN